MEDNSVLILGSLCLPIYILNTAVGVKKTTLKSKKNERRKNIFLVLWFLPDQLLGKLTKYNILIIYIMFQYERFFQPASTCVATFFAPIQFSPSTVLCFKVSKLKINISLKLLLLSKISVLLLKSKVKIFLLICICHISVAFLLFLFF